MTAKQTNSNFSFERYFEHMESSSDAPRTQVLGEYNQSAAPLYSGTVPTLPSSSNGRFCPQRPRSLSLPSNLRPLGWLAPSSPVAVNARESYILDPNESSPSISPPSTRSSTVFSSRSSRFLEPRIITPSPVSSSAEGFPSSPTVVKGKGRVVEILAADGHEHTWLEDAPHTPSRDLDDMGLDEISRRDEELALAITIEDLRSEGCTDAEVQQYLVQLKALSAQKVEENSRSFSPSLPMERALPALTSPVYETYHAVESIIDPLANRKLPPAYGPDYTPEASTSSAGSPVLTSRRLSVSSHNGTTRVFPRGDAPRASFEISLPDQASRLEIEMERRLEEVFQRHKREVLREWNEIRASLHRELRMEDIRHGLHERAMGSGHEHGPHFVPRSPDGGRGSHDPNRGQDSSSRKYSLFWYPHLGF
ncbi:hypothetical protein FRB91_002610 [Serendipita sp. 411]|nr:hypothetical protein FRB91_002610 [Serendipita sp. 411]